MARRRTFRPTLFAAAALLLAGCASATADKPVDTEEMRDDATPELGDYAARVLGGEGGKEVRLVSATPFSEGHVHATWKLVVHVDGKAGHYSLKVFPDAAAAERDAGNHRVAREAGWPVPTDVHRGTAEPYQALPASLQEYVSGRSLARTITDRMKAEKEAGPEAIAGLYARVGEVLGRLHTAATRDRADGDISGTTAMRALADRCELDNLCGPYATKRFRQLAPGLDQDKVTFVHGDLYEAQVILDDAGKLASFVDLDESGYGDPALDLGTLLAHLLIVNPLAREPVWGVANPEPPELKACTAQLLAAYRKGAGITDGWADFVARAKGYMHLRIGQLLLKLRGNVHAKPMIDLVDKKRAGLFVIDPFEEHGIGVE